MLLLRNFLLFVFSLSLTQACLALPMDNEPSESSSYGAGAATPSTPAAAAAAAAVNAEPTPGQKVAQAQATALRREVFEEVFGVDTVKEWGIQWSVFLEDLSDPHTSGKRDNIRRLASLLLPLRDTSDLTRRLFSDVAALHIDMREVHALRLKEVVGASLRRLYPNCKNIAFSYKEGGTQMGAIATVTLERGEQVKIFAKTHSRGRTEFFSSGAKPLDPKELMVYKVLENLGLGCKAYFCARSPEDVYIATLDAAAEGRFYTLEQGSQDEERVGRILWGRLGQHITKSPRQSNAAVVEEILATDPTAQHFAKQAMILNVLGRILRLDDIFDNQGNLGFVQVTGNSLFDLRILDFRFLEKNRLEFTHDHFDGFLEGNGPFNPIAAHRILSYLLHYRGEKQRVHSALMMTETLQKLDRAIEEAYTFVYAYISQDSAFESQRDTFLETLTAYRDIVRQNLTLFIERLQRYKREVLDSVHRDEGAAPATAPNKHDM